MKDSLKALEVTHDLGVKPSVVDGSKTSTPASFVIQLNSFIKIVCYLQGFPVLLGVEPSVNQRLLPPTFPRYIHIHSFESAIKELNKIIDHIPSLVSLFKFANFNQVFVNIWLFDFYSIYSYVIFAIVNLPYLRVDLMVSM